LIDQRTNIKPIQKKSELVKQFNTLQMNRKILLTIICVFTFIQVSFRQIETSKGIHTSYIKYGGLDRKYMYYIPAGYNPQAKSPVVFFLHGMGASAQIAVNVLGAQYHARAERDNAIVVYPEAVSKHWNDLLGGSYPATDNVNDVGFISALIDVFINDYKCDPRRVYISGSSNGGMMTYRLSCDIPGKIAAIAPFISAISPEVAKEFSKAQPIPIMITSGTGDPTIKWEGGPIIVTGTPEVLSGDKNVEYWVMRNHAKKKPEVTKLPDIASDDNSTVERYQYKGKYDVVLYKIINGAHQHPMLREANKPLVKGQNNDYNSFETVWDFMLSYKKPK
jgi:polyhydroxybutyrate depolymerase